MDRLPLLLAMGLAGILTIALIVSADQSYAGITGMRAVTAYAPTNEQDPPARGQLPVLGGLVDGIRELPFFAPPSPVPTAPPVSSAAATPASTVAAPTVSAPSAASPVPTTTPLPPRSPAAPAPATSSPAPPVSTAPPPPPAVLLVSTDRGARSIVTLGGLVPGDTIVRTITVKNSGTLGFRYAVSASQTASTALWTDPVSGLQLTVADAAGSILYSGALSALGSLAGPGTLAPGSAELLRYTFSFPASAPDSFQSLVQDLTLVFTATQYP